MAKEQEALPEETSSGSGELDDAFFEKATGRDQYFKPEANVDHHLVLTGWKKKEIMGNLGVQFDVLNVDGKAIEPGEKRWTVTSKRTMKEIEPILKAAMKAKKGNLNITFRKNLGRGEKDTDAKFVAWNKDPDLDQYIEPDQRSDKAPGMK